jgi:hypothetical protein
LGVCIYINISQFPFNTNKSRRRNYTTSANFNYGRKVHCSWPRIQNYTCAAVNSTPVQLGALATLFDATAFAFADEDDFNAMPPIAVYIPLPVIYSSPLTTELFPVLGYHYFSFDGTPVFNLTSVSRTFYGKTTYNLKAPASANKGPAGTGAVDWLQLQDKGGSNGVTEVYRLITAGGAAPVVCTTTGVVSVPYTAEYWFYDY